MKTLIVFYSLEGNTHFIAEAMAKEIGADILELKPKKEIPTSSFGKYFWGGRQVMMKASPELVSYDINPDLYDVIILGTPVWAWTYTPALRTFLSNHPMKSKKLAFFCCYGGNAGKTLENFKVATQNNTHLGEISFLEPLKTPIESAKKEKEWITRIATAELSQ